MPDEDVLPAYSKIGQDAVGLTSRIMDNVRIVWFSFETKENGAKPVSVTVRDRETGQTVYGQTFLVEVSYDLPGLVSKAVGSFSLFFGVFMSLAKVLKLPV